MNICPGSWKFNNPFLLLDTENKTMGKIIVATDFTSVSNIAVRYACGVGSSTKSEVYLLHIVKNKNEVDSANEKMAAQASFHSVETGYPVKYIARVGNIFDDIPNVAEEEKAELIVMGTHGLQGMQFIVGSNALRIVTESKVPVVIVQDQTTQSAKVSRLLLPIDLHQETKQKLRIAGEVARRYQAEVHLISPKETDEFLHNRLARNISYSEGFLEEQGIAYKTVVTQSGSSGFVKDLLKYAEENAIDMICILNTAEERLVHAFGVDSEQKIITNEAGIPVMILNPSVTYKDSTSIFAQ
jgi:nucleotide-binding universal stress UspA family protein